MQVEIQHNLHKKNSYLNLFLEAQASFFYASKIVLIKTDNLPVKNLR